MTKIVNISETVYVIVLCVCVRLCVCQLVYVSVVLQCVFVIKFSETAFCFARGEPTERRHAKTFFDLYAVAIILP